METNNFKQIKDFTITQLSGVSGPLRENQIADTISLVKEMLAEGTLKKLLQVPKEATFTKDDWDQMRKDLEVHFDVKMAQGSLIQGEEQKNRDNLWWSDSKKQEVENYYWGRYKAYIKPKLPPDVVKTLDTDTDVVMNNIEDPAIDNFSRYGMVVGHVQSGKTSNYSALICKAADAGYKFIVIVAGGTNNLRNQTQDRINKAFVGQDRGKLVGVGQRGGAPRERIPISLTTVEQDFNKRDADRNSQGVNFENINSPILVVIKKNSRSFKNVIGWLEAQYKNGIESHSMLLIDDESDYGSINTGEDNDPTQINKLTRKLLGLFRKSVYVAYTATPYANIFIDHEAATEDLGNDLFPKDFIYAIDAPSNYFGARKIFLENEKTYIVEIGDYSESIPTKHKKDFELKSIPESLKEAIRLFIINIAARALRNQKNEHNSMLVHATRFTRVHQKISFEIERYLEALKNEINAYGKLSKPENRSKIIGDIKETLYLRQPNVGFDWPQVIDSIISTVGTVVVKEVHQGSKIPLEYSEDRPTYAIVVGGSSLSRGYTLEGLSVSYFLRNSVFYDTLMQMGRWFGYRTGYDDLCRIYMPPEIKKGFAYIIDATEDLFDDFKRMAVAKKTPYDFGLCVKQHPDSLLQVTARNKQKNAKTVFFEMRLDGRIKETAWLNSEPNIQRNNLDAVIQILDLLMKKEAPTSVKGHYLWRDIDKAIIQNFLERFQTYQGDQFGIGNKMPIEFVKKYIMEDKRPWDVALYSGNGDEFKLIENLSVNPENRKIKDQGKYFEVANRQVSSGNAESITLTEDDQRELGSDRKEARSRMVKPLLMLHILNDENTHIHHLAAFGVSFPGGVETVTKPVKMVVNSVYIKNIEDYLNYENDYDDQ